MHNLKELKIWHKAIELATEVYAVTANFPMEEKFGLTSPIRRSAVPVPSNIAECAGRNSNKEFCQFLGISNELQMQLIISNNFQLITTGEVEPLLIKITEVQKMNYTFQKLPRQVK